MIIFLTHSHTPLRATSPFLNHFLSWLWIVFPVNISMIKLKNLCILLLSFSSLKRIPQTIENPKSKYVRQFTNDLECAWPLVVVTVVAVIIVTTCTFVVNRRTDTNKTKSKWLLIYSSKWVDVVYTNVRPNERIVFVWLCVWVYRTERGVFCSHVN